MVRPGQLVGTFGASLLVFSGCDSQRAGGGGTGGSGGSGASSGGGGARSTTPATTQPSISSGDPTSPCGTPAGEPCSEGALCDPSISGACSDAGDYHCEEYDPQTCDTLERPFCAPGGGLPSSCGNGLMACACTGSVLAQDCIRFQHVARDPSSCSHALFPCGPEQCREWVDVCVQSAAGAADGHCEPAADLGCTEYGVADCRCLEIDQDAQSCSNSEAWGVTRVIDRPTKERRR